MIMYAEFVTSRIKWLGDPTLDIVHAAMGLLGEAVEYYNATSQPNRLEELGDLEFYTEHATQALSNLHPNTQFYTEVSREEARGIQADIPRALLHWTSEFHDRAKKLWIYNKKTVDFHAPLVRTRICLHFLTAEFGYLREDLQKQNQAKLEKRFPSGYSDSAAQARADKIGEKDDRA